MGSEKGELYSIGEVARRSGVPVKTIRHYSDVGVLLPSRITEAGYRMYSEQDRSRLELVRTLRAAGFGLPEIRAMLEGENGTSDTLRLQIDTVDLQLRTLRRRRKLLESALEGGEGTEHRYPDRVQALGLLEAKEREAFLAEHLERGLEGVQVDPDTKAWFWKGVVSGMPEELDEEQLAAWTELAQLASDESFVEALREQIKPVSEVAEEEFDPAGWSEAVKAAFDEGVEAVQEGRSPTGEYEQRVIADWIEASALATCTQHDPRFAEWMLAHFERTHDPRMERYWELIAVLKRWEYDPAIAKAYRWLVEGLRWRVTGSRRANGESTVSSN